jgi:peptidoglycan/LPS O-acetylase OafA/YrhL
MPTTDAADTTQSSVHLDAIRGAAALVVVVWHNRDGYFSSVFGKHENAAALSTSQAIPAGIGTSRMEQLTIGNEAVMIFFVLSGYLVGGGVIRAVRRGIWSWKDYLLKRLTRLWVVLIPALLLGVALDFAGLYLHQSGTSIYAGPPGQNMTHVGLASRLTFSVIAGNAVFLQGARINVAGTNGPLWSLTNEFWYYIAFPLLLLALSKKQKLWIRFVYVLMFAAIGVLVGSDVSVLFFIWILGALLSVIPLRVSRVISKVMAGIMAAFLPILFSMAPRFSLPATVARLFVAIYFLMFLYLLLHRTERARDGVYRKISEFFSHISYTLYLVDPEKVIFRQIEVEYRGLAGLAG